MGNRCHTHTQLKNTTKHCMDTTFLAGVLESSFCLCLQGILDAAIIGPLYTRGQFLPNPEEVFFYFEREKCIVFSGTDCWSLSSGSRPYLVFWPRDWKLSGPTWVTLPSSLLSLLLLSWTEPRCPHPWAWPRGLDADKHACSGLRAPDRKFGKALSRKCPKAMLATLALVIPSSLEKDLPFPAHLCPACVLTQCECTVCQLSVETVESRMLTTHQADFGVSVQVFCLSNFENLNGNTKSQPNTYVFTKTPWCESEKIAS